MSSDPYEASVSAALSSMNINSEAAAQGNLFRGIDNRDDRLYRTVLFQQRSILAFLTYLSSYYNLVVSK